MCHGNIKNLGVRRDVLIRVALINRPIGTHDEYTEAVRTITLEIVHRDSNVLTRRTCHSVPRKRLIIFHPLHGIVSGVRNHASERKSQLSVR